MAQYVPLTPQRHGSKALGRISGFSFAASVNLVAIAGVEFGSAASSMPIAFVEESKTYKPVALLSFVGGRNLFVAPNGQWLGRYIPASFRYYPLRLLRRDPTSEEYILCLDEECPAIVDAGGDAQPLFSPDGDVAPWVKAATEAMQVFERSRRHTARAVDALASAGAICPWPIKVKVLDGEHTVPDLHRIDEMALGRLSDAAFLTLRNASALPLAYAQLLSLTQLEVLQRLAGMQTELARSPSSPAGTPGGAFLTNDESLHFG